MIKKVYICSGFYVDIGYMDLVPYVHGRQLEVTQQLIDTYRKTLHYIKTKEL
jgi:hypothetical protein